MKYFIFAAIVTVVSGAISSPTKYETSGGFLPSSMRYYNEQASVRENRTSDSQLTGSNNVETKIAKDDRLQRFGASGFGTSGYPNSGTGVSSYAPMKIDLGGVVLGTLIGLGAILIIPKFAHIFSGGYRRSVEGEIESVNDILSKVDKALEEHHIDSSTCMQRIVCSYVQESQKNIASGQPNTLDDLIYSVTNNSMMSFLLDGTAIQQAIKLGKMSDPESCTSLYSKCPISKENVMQVITSLLPA